MEKKSIAKNYVFLAVMLGAMILGAILGWVWPAEVDGDGNILSGTGATVLKPLGTVFINLMFCVVVPRGLRTVAPVPDMTLPSPSTWAGQTQPRMAPRIMAPSMTAKKA